MKSLSTNWPANTDPRRNPFRRTARAPERGRVVYAPNGPTANARGFTLTEILVALALVLIIGAIAAVDMRGIASGINHLPPRQVLQSAIREGRYLAMLRMDNVILTYNGDAHSFDLLDDKGNILEQEPDGIDNPDTTLKVTFTPVLALTDLVSDPATESDDDNNLSKLPTPRLIFHATGATPEVKVTMSLNGTDTKFNLDSFSEGPPPTFPTNVPPLPPDTN